MTDPVEHVLREFASNNARKALLAATEAELKTVSLSETFYSLVTLLHIAENDVAAARLTIKRSNKLTTSPSLTLLHEVLQHLVIFDTARAWDSVSKVAAAAAPIAPNHNEGFLSVTREAQLTVLALHAKFAVVRNGGAAAMADGRAADITKRALQSLSNVPEQYVDVVLQRQHSLSSSSSSGAAAEQGWSTAEKMARLSAVASIMHQSNKQQSGGRDDGARRPASGGFGRAGSDMWLP